MKSQELFVWFVLGSAVGCSANGTAVGSPSSSKDDADGSAARGHDSGTVPTGGGSGSGATGPGGSSTGGTPTGGAATGGSGGTPTGGTATGGSGGTPTGGTHPYPSCVDEEARGDCKCVRSSTNPAEGQEVCVPTCGSLGGSDLRPCPVHESGEGTVECLHTWTFLTDEYTHGCILTCESSLDCPDGMTCDSGANGILFCGWARPL